MSKTWENNTIQFARLLAEIASTVEFTESDMAELCFNMDLEPADIDELFDRAQERWEDIKQYQWTPDGMMIAGNPDNGRPVDIEVEETYSRKLRVYAEDIDDASDTATGINDFFLDIGDYITDSSTHSVVNKD